MQAIYEYSVSEYRNINKAKKNLMRSFDDMYMLYIRILALLPTLTHIAEQVIEIKKQKYLPTTTDLKPNVKFINNAFIQKLEQNTDLQRLILENNLEWNHEKDLPFVRKIYAAMCNEDFFIEYLQGNETTFEKDKQLVLSILEKFMLENEEMIHYFGEIKLSWLHDYNDVIIFVHNTLREFSQKQSDDKPLPTLFKITKDGGSEEVYFAQHLLIQTLQHDQEFGKIISDRIQNWDMERVAYVDFILLKMAICEFCEFPSIPLRVTMNEYIEISKYYSTPKSRLFINGLLDNILLYLKSEDRIHKQGRGLMG